MQCSLDSFERGRKIYEERGNIAMPVVLLVTGDEFKKNGILPVLHI
jgi:hypothetical protein